MKGEYNVTVKLSMEFEIDIRTGDSGEEILAEERARNKVIQMFGLDDKTKPTHTWGFKLELDAIEYED